MQGKQGRADFLASRIHAIMTCLHRTKRRIGRNDKPDNIPLPLMTTTIAGHDIWNASALFPAEEHFESLLFIRRRFPEAFAWMTTGKFNLKEGANRNHNIPFQEIVTDKMWAYASGNCKEVKRILKKHLKCIGRKGTGIVVDITTKSTPEDWSLVKNGLAMRWLPDPGGSRMVRTAPPYWNAIDRVPCCEVGDEYRWQV